MALQPPQLKLEQCIDIASTIELGGYGTVSYTWEYIKDFKIPQPDGELLGLLWDVPRTTGFDLNRGKEVMKTLDSSREGGRWLVRGCALQEGVLLHETVLIGSVSKTLSDDTFQHNGGRASVIDLTARITALAIAVAKSFLLQANGQEPQNSIGGVTSQ
ncbi:predicted protein [Sclerotinia sclerotiorum 1980 UF-70]|uniref:Uncharacterized protein n=2 Tax=Sclerotinia sclerotiorum (strain ATCC 18683 / 1980 / Ss-1) TaxID=665079 RepID=A7EY11_SCLS1|nr:predicted protein [Sclerotinia sclerotiorum 1980 UF-70]APA16087.1 hypothetical protein sscle_16g108570 [Sclerotinia sclerotiorum 1980 UF-70]EDN94353.1 predicted protein [Sclerotinia sclerotiorum 1980 UF-70]